MIGCPTPTCIPSVGRIDAVTFTSGVSVRNDAVDVAFRSPWATVAVTAYVALGESGPVVIQRFPAGARCPATTAPLVDTTETAVNRSERVATTTGASSATFVVPDTGAIVTPAASTARCAATARAAVARCATTEGARDDGVERAAKLAVTKMPAQSAIASPATTTPPDQ